MRNVYFTYIGHLSVFQSTISNVCLLKVITRVRLQDKQIVNSLQLNKTQHNKYISNCIRSMKFAYQHNAYVTTYIVINSVRPGQRRFVKNTNFYPPPQQKKTLQCMELLTFQTNFMYILM